MSRFVDFQVSVDWYSKVVNEELFATYEPIRLWIREQRLQAPFRKLLISLQGHAGAFRHGMVVNVLGICEVNVAVDDRAACAGAADLSWVAGVIDQGLAVVASELRWEGAAELREQVARFGQSKWPLVHTFEKWARSDRRSGLTWQPVMIFEPRRTTFAVRLSELHRRSWRQSDGTTGDAHHSREVSVIAVNRPFDLYYDLEYDFTVAGSALRDGDFVLLSKDKRVMARISPDGAVANVTRR